MLSKIDSSAIGLAFVRAMVGEYLGSSRDVGYLILQAEGEFDINTVMAGILVLTAFALALEAGFTASRVGLSANRLVIDWNGLS